MTLHVKAYTLNSVKNVILYDGMCNFCNKWVDTLINLDKSKVFKFTALQSDKGKELLSMVGRNPNDLSTVVYIRNIQEIYVKSDVPLQVMKDLKGGFFFLGSAFNVIPLQLRNPIYDIVAKNRYNFLGKREECRCSAGDDIV